MEAVRCLSFDRCNTTNLTQDYYTADFSFFKIHLFQKYNFILMLKCFN